MNKIYKYMAWRPEFFDGFYLRASQRGVLNDPFEFNPAFDLGEQFVALRKDETFNRELNRFSSDLKFNDVGVISFTENHNNLLMWSHYADQHKGVVVEFDYRKLEAYFNNRFSMESSIARVLYNRERCSSLLEDVCLKDFLLTKSDDWLYEKEHRVLAHLIHADKLVVNAMLYKSLHEFYSGDYKRLFTKECACVEKGTVTIRLNAKYIKLLDDCFADGSSTDDCEEKELTESQAVIYDFYYGFLKDPSTMLLFKMPEDSVTAVYLGCRFIEQDVTSLMTKINNKNIKVFRAKPSETLFSLDFCKI
ncbi:DUF2971 domain-containing protein [Pseudaeromonas sharmana]|uniref:DUF2971 domain-containing protein n=1 Tax=Pseudaeromonas sharmana TaxID=328412 RepID=A0ABV8CQZ2_9GAMM